MSNNTSSLTDWEQSYRNRIHQLYGSTNLNPCFMDDDESERETYTGAPSTVASSQRRLRRETIIQNNILEITDNLAVDPEATKTKCIAKAIRLAEEIVYNRLLRDGKISQRDIDYLSIARQLDNHKELIEMEYDQLLDPMAVAAAANDLAAAFVQLFERIRITLINRELDAFTAEEKNNAVRIRKLIEDEFVQYASRGLWPDGTPGGNIQISRIIAVGTDLPERMNCGLGFINGIANEFSDAYSNAIRLCDIAHAEIKLVYNPTHGKLKDALAAIKGKKDEGEDFLTFNERLLLLQWQEFFDSHGPEAKFHQICHSKGAIHVKNALAKAPELRDRIVVTAFAPASIICDGECLDVHNYISEKDTLLLGMHKIFSPENLKELEILSANEQAVGYDHSFDSPTFKENIEKSIKEFYNKYGGTQ